MLLQYIVYLCIYEHYFILTIANTCILYTYYITVFLVYMCVFCGVYIFILYTSIRRKRSTYTFFKLSEKTKDGVRLSHSLITLALALTREDFLRGG